MALSITRDGDVITFSGSVSAHDWSEFDRITEALNDEVGKDTVVAVPAVPAYGHFDVGDAVVIVHSDNGANIGRNGTVIDEPFGSPSNVLFVRLADGSGPTKKVAFNRDDLRAGKVALAG